MRTHVALIALVATVLTGTACGNASPDVVENTIQLGGADSVRGAPSTAIAATTTADAPTSEAGDPTGYLVEVSNLVADYLDAAGGFGHTYTDQNPQPTTEQERIEFMAGYLHGWANVALDHSAAFAALTPPAAFEGAHVRYGETLRDVYEEWQRIVSGFTTLAELEAFWNSASDPSSGMAGSLGERHLAFVAACADLERVAADVGYELDLMCPEPPADAIEVSVAAGDVWRATPDRLPAGTELVALKITNLGTDPIRPVVLDIFEGDPRNLPVAEGLVDITLNGVIDPASGYAAFGVAYPDGLFGDDSRLIGEPPELAPGESITVRLWISGDIVIFDYRDGAYEAGSRVVIDSG